MNATQVVTENRMQPVTKSENPKLTVLRGQYLYDTFMTPSDGETTKMAIIRKWADDGYLPDDVKGAADNMVQIAREKDAAKWEGKKNDKGVPVGDDGKKVRLVNEQTAMNMRGIIQTAFGALRFARPELEKEGYTEKTGYQAMRVLAKRALDAKRIEWNGEPVKTDADRERDRLRKEQKDVLKARQEAMSKLPQNPGESEQDYYARLADFSRQTIEAAKNEAETNLVTELFQKLLEKHGIERMIHIAQMVCDHEQITLEPTHADDDTQAADPEPSEEEVAARMAAVSEEQAAH